MSTFFPEIEAIRYQGPDSDNPLAFKWYQPELEILGKPMREQLRFAVCYWHSFCWQGNDPFGAPTLRRPWFETGEPMAQARLKARVAFEFFAKLGVPYFAFHDRDVAPEGPTLRDSNANLAIMTDVIAEQMEATGVQLLWGTANLFSHRRYLAGAATNPDPDVFAYAAAQVKQAMETTHRLGGSNYVLWGGREGYDTLLNTDLQRESEQLGRFMTLVVEHKHRIGFDGTILIEPKPQEPTKHQYDYDAATVHAFLQKHGLDKEIRLNIEANHATLAGHSFEHEIAYALANNLFGSIDINRGDPQNGWDTDQFPNNVVEVALALYQIMLAGGFTTGGLNFDAKLRRQSIDADDLFHAHIGGMDTCARALLMAARMINSGELENRRQQRYRGWDEELGRGILDGDMSMADLADYIHDDDIEPRPRSGRQEMLENLVNRFL